MQQTPLQLQVSIKGTCKFILFANHIVVPILLIVGPSSHVNQLVLEVELSMSSSAWRFLGIRRVCHSM